MPLKFQLDRLTLTPVRVRWKSDSKTDTHTHRRIVQNHFSRRFEGCTSQIRSISESIFCTMLTLPWDIKVKWFFRWRLFYQMGCSWRLSTMWLRVWDKKIAEIRFTGGYSWTEISLKSIQNILVGQKLRMHSCNPMQYTFEHADCP